MVLTMRMVMSTETWPMDPQLAWWLLLERMAAKLPPSRNFLQHEPWTLWEQPSDEEYGESYAFSYWQE